MKATQCNPGTTRLGGHPQYLCAVVVNKFFPSFPDFTWQRLSALGIACSKLADGYRGALQWLAASGATGAVIQS